MKTKHLSVLCACLTMALAPFASGQIKYHAFIWNNDTGMTDLGTLGGNISYGLGINDSGEVVGYSYLADNVTRHAFTWTAAGGMVDLGTLAGGTWSQGEAVNSKGEIAGEGSDSRGKQVPLFWSPARGFHSLGENVGDPRNFGLGINDGAVLTGQQYTGSVVNAFIWSVSSPTIEYLPPLPGGLHMVGYDINNRSHITGNGSLADGRYAAFVWSAQGGTIEIGAVAGASSTLGHAINDNDEVAGIAYLSSSTGGFYWKRGVGLVTLQTLGGATGAGSDIDLAGEIVGWSSNASGAIHASTWANYTSAPTDLGTLPGGTDSYARSINASGQVVGYSNLP